MTDFTAGAALATIPPRGAAHPDWALPPRPLRRRGAVVTSAVVTGRMWLRPWASPCRALSHLRGRAGYRHYIETTWFGLPVMRVNRWYLDGYGWNAVQGTVEGPPTRRATWGCGRRPPSSPPSGSPTRGCVGGDRRRTALLVVPFGDAEERFVVASTRERAPVSRRCATATGRADLWLAATVPGRTVTAAGALDATGAATWLDQGRPGRRSPPEIVQRGRRRVHPRPGVSGPPAPPSPLPSTPSEVVASHQVPRPRLAMCIFPSNNIEI